MSRRVAEFPASADERLHGGRVVRHGREDAAVLQGQAPGCGDDRRGGWAAWVERRGGEALGEPDGGGGEEGGDAAVVLVESLREEPAGDDAGDVVGHQHGDRGEWISCLQVPDDVLQFLERSAAVRGHADAPLATGVPAPARHALYTAPSSTTSPTVRSATVTLR